MPTVLLTGTAGFIGGRLAEVLYLNQSARVRAGIRRWSGAARIARFPMEIVSCDILDREQVARAMRGASTVIHCAYTDSRQVIVEGTRNMLELALRNGVRRFVYLSTAEVYGHVSGSIDETCPYQYTGREYTDSKIEAEKLCWEFLHNGLPVTILRPSIVYGPFSQRTIGFAQRLQSSNWGVFQGYGEGKCNLVYIDDLVAAVLLAAQRREAVGQAFNINGPDTITWNQFFERFNVALGLGQLATIPAARSRLRAAIRDRISTLSRFSQDQCRGLLMRLYLRRGLAGRAMKRMKDSLFTTPSTSELQNLYSRDALYVDAKAKAMLDYEPSFDLEAGLRLSVLWLKHHGLLNQAPAGLERPIPLTAQRQ